MSDETWRNLNANPSTASEITLETVQLTIDGLVEQWRDRELRLVQEMIGEKAHTIRAGKSVFSTLKDTIRYPLPSYRGERRFCIGTRSHNIAVETCEYLPDDTAVLIGYDPKSPLKQKIVGIWHFKSQPDDLNGLAGSVAAGDPDTGAAAQRHEKIQPERIGTRDDRDTLIAGDALQSEPGCCPENDGDSLRS